MSNGFDDLNLDGFLDEGESQQQETAVEEEQAEVKDEKPADGDAEQAEEAEAQAQPEPTPDPTPAPGNFDKGLANLQDKFADFKRDQENRYGELRDLIQGVHKNTAPAEEPEDDDEFVDRASLKRIISEAVRPIQDKLDRAEQSENLRAHWAEWDRQNPGLAGKGPAIWEKASEQAAAMGLPEDQQFGAAKVFESQIINQLAAKQTPAQTPPTPAPPSSSPPKSPEGATVKPTGAKTSDRRPDHEPVDPSTLDPDELDFSDLIGL